MIDLLHRAGGGRLVNPNWKLANVEHLDLETLGTHLKSVDRLILELAAQRLELARRVEEFKRERKQSMYRKEVESKRLDEVEKWALELGINPDFARALQYFNIGESCKVQTIQMQDAAQHFPDFPDETSAAGWHKEQLLELTRHCAQDYDKRYTDTFFATRMYLEFESEVITSVLEGLERKRVALDLGCATGRQSFFLSRFFNRVLGLDISPNMIEVANRKKNEKKSKNIMGFQTADIGKGIPCENGQADMVLMGMGFASDVPETAFILSEVERVLNHKGLAVLSFYNRNAIIYSWQFIPWPLALAASINMQRHCLDVHWADNVKESSNDEKVEGKTFSIYAKPFTASEVEAALPPNMTVIQQYTHPTVASVLPNVLFSDKSVAKSVTEIDKHLVDQESGAYLLVVTRKS